MFMHRFYHGYTKLKWLKKQCLINEGMCSALTVPKMMDQGGQRSNLGRMILISSGARSDKPGSGGIESRTPKKKDKRPDEVFSEEKFIEK